MEATNFWEGKRVLLVGGTGFIGSHLTKRLVSVGADIGMVVHETYPPNKKMIVVWGDVSVKSDLIRSRVQDFEPEIVFYLAAQPIVGRASKDGIEALEVNARGSYLFLNTCRSIKSIQSIVYLSTDKVYGDIEVIGDESELRGVAHPYNASKLMGDVSAQLYKKFYDLPITILRHGNIYGPNDLHWDRIIPRTLLKIFYNESPTVRGNNRESTRDYIFIDDIVDGYLKAAELDCLTILNLGSAVSYSAFEIVSKLLKICNKDIPIKKEELWKGELVHQHFEKTKSSESIGWCPKVNIDDGLKITADWYMKYFEESHG